MDSTTSVLAGKNYVQALFLIFKVLQRVRDALQARGAKTIRGLGKTFRSMDSYDGNKRIDKDEFFIGLRENGVQLSKQEADVILFS